MALLIRPLASYAVAGHTTFKPGVRTNHISGFCEWNGPPWIPPPDGERTTIGTGAFHRYRHLAAKFTIWSNPQVMKSANCISATGRSPIRLAPIDAPTVAASEM